MALKGKQICTTYKNTWYLNPENHVLNICMTAFTVILKTLPTLSSAMGLFLEDGLTAETALPFSVFGERLDLKAMWPLRTKKDGIFKCLKGILLTLHFLSLLWIEGSNIYDSTYAFLNLKDVITDLSETFPLVEYCKYLQTIYNL